MGCHSISYECEGRRALVSWCFRPKKFVDIQQLMTLVQFISLWKEVRSEENDKYSRLSFA